MKRVNHGKVGGGAKQIFSYDCLFSTVLKYAVLMYFDGTWDRFESNSNCSTSRVGETKKGAG